MDKEEIRELAIAIVNEIRKNFVNARKSKTDSVGKVKSVIKRINIVETGNSFQIHIPLELSTYRYGIKNIKFDAKATYIEQSVSRGVKSYFNAKGKESKVTL